ncbi:MAG TPA: alkaline phosphatase family protein [Hyphomicrobiaceae bacterium]|nr:alkaline phosphatase family protein [Hyphomicrobiaceae bacterium]
MASGTNQRILVVVFDALRPEFVTPELMPNLHRFAEGGVRYTNSHAVFLTETRVNQSAVVTGCMPQRHGIVANKFFAPEVYPGRVLNTGDDMQLEAAFNRLNGRLLDVPTLGQRLRKNNKRYATLSAGTPGGGRLINHGAENDGSFRFAMRRPEAACPPDSLERIAGRIGPIPAYELPATKWISWAVDAYLSDIEPTISPDVMLLWLCEPDESFHKLGIGSDGALTTIRHIDAEFGRILAHHKSAIDNGIMQIIAMSDHGQITLQGEALDVIGQMNAAGFRASNQPGEQVDYIVVPGNAVAIWCSNADAELAANMTHWLRQQSWCGPLLAKIEAPNAILLDEVRNAHRRSPDIAFTFANTDENNINGRAGLSLHDAPYPVGGGCHGGLSRHEINNVLTLSGSAFKAGMTTDTPAGNIDITPTILALLGIDVPSGEFDGRPLLEAFRAGPDPSTLSWTDQTITSQPPATSGLQPQTQLSVTDLGTTRYINQAWLKSKSRD